jgi:hypothetical protein
MNASTNRISFNPSLVTTGYFNTPDMLKTFILIEVRTYAPPPP